MLSWNSQAGEAAGAESLSRWKPRPPADLAFSFDANKQQRQLIAELENKNRYSLWDTPGPSSAAPPRPRCFPRAPPGLHCLTN
ncbi:hypothetical protein DV515_00016620 [Chloebia gouldiae]|uniref:Uncharacterized protein n=1 Tax=Chloebia gouldiae TaxID=44316 RepID=A0A3L8RRU2_CHLGU|nr:hypothetical protein DV515_00016620 [Chloebia gouldiae]